MEKQDYYEVLGVSRDAGEPAIKAAYRKMALKYHPDRNQEAGAEDKFKVCSEAYEVLSDPEKRRVYDQFGHAGLSGQGFSGFNDVNDIFSNFGSIFEDFFGFSSTGGRRRARRGADLRYDLKLTFREAVFGVEKEIEFSREAQCKTCHGTKAKPGTSKKPCTGCGGAGQVRRSQGFFSIAVACPQCGGEGAMVVEHCTACHGKGSIAEKRKVSVRIPAGVDQGVRLRVGGEGQIGTEGGQAGDLYVFLDIEESKEFERDGFDLIHRRVLGIAQAALGCTLKVPTLEGEREIEVPAGTQYGQRMVLSGDGVPRLKGTGRGDLHIEFAVHVPTKLSKDQRDLLQKYAAVAKEDIAHASGGFFHKLFGDT